MFRVTLVLAAALGAHACTPEPTEDPPVTAWQSGCAWGSRCTAQIAMFHTTGGASSGTPMRETILTGWSYTFPPSGADLRILSQRTSSAIRSH
jgi:hypothetical protein